MKALPSLLAVVGGLLLIGGTLANWQVLETPIFPLPGGGPVYVTDMSAGFQWSFLSIPVGAAGLVLAPALAFPTLRRLAALLHGVLGTAGLGSVVFGVWGITRYPDGPITPAPAVTALGALLVVGAAVLALRPPRPRAVPTDDPDLAEWEGTAVEDDAQ